MDFLMLFHTTHVTVEVKQKPWNNATGGDYFMTLLTLQIASYLLHLWDPDQYPSERVKNPMFQWSTNDSLLVEVGGWGG